MPLNDMTLADLCDLAEDLAALCRVGGDLAASGLCPVFDLTPGQPVTITVPFALPAAAVPQRMPTRVELARARDDSPKVLGTVPQGTVITDQSIRQVIASVLTAISPTATVEILRAYADVIDAGPGDGPAQAAARARFDAAAQAFIPVARAQRDFPQPQGRA